MGNHSQIHVEKSLLLYAGRGVWKFDRGCGATKQNAKRQVSDIAAGIKTAVTLIHMTLLVFVSCIYDKSIEEDSLLCDSFK
jgi:hypothetical protein